MLFIVICLEIFWVIKNLYYKTNDENSSSKCGAKENGRNFDMENQKLQEKQIQSNFKYEYSVPNNIQS